MNQRLTALVLCGFLAAPSLSFAAAASPSGSGSCSKKQSEGGGWRLPERPCPHCKRQDP